jgi:glycosyltransferase involved in cell wall biosynthesis
MTQLMAVILTKNEARHIAECIKSVAWADCVLLSDSFSQDGTVEIARGLGAEVVQSPFINFSEQRNIALAESRSRGANWVFFIDADERATPELGAEMRQVTQPPDGRGGATRGDIVGWWVPRYNHIMGHRMRGGGWYPDTQLRLLRPDCARYDPKRQVHEIAILDGNEGTLREHMIHYNYDSLAQFRAKQERYLLFEARVLHEKGIHPRPWTYLSMPLREFWRRFVTLHGHRDGWIGLLLCGLMAWYTFKSYRQLASLWREGS